jgi:hypothetical protein
MKQELDEESRDSLVKYRFDRANPRCMKSDKAATMRISFFVTNRM